MIRPRGTAGATLLNTYNPYLDISSPRWERDSPGSRVMGKRLSSSRVLRVRLSKQCRTFGCRAVFMVWTRTLPDTSLLEANCPKILMG